MQLSEQRSPASAAGCYRTALSHFEAARDVRRRGPAFLSLVLYREAVSLALHLLGEEEGETAAQLAHLKPLLNERDPLFPDRLASDDVRRKAEALDELAARLLQNAKARLPDDYERRRRVRSAAWLTIAAVVSAVSAFFFLLPKNLARHRPALSSSRLFDTVPEAAVDGDNFTAYGFHSALEGSPWLSIDLGHPHRLTRVKIYGRGDCCYDQSVPLALEISEDGVEFHEIAERTSPFSRRSPWIVEGLSAEARFVRLRTKRSSYLVLSEVEVYGSSP